MTLLEWRLVLIVAWCETALPVFQTLPGSTSTEQKKKKPGYQKPYSPLGSRSSEEIVDLGSSQTCNLSFFPEMTDPYTDSLWHDECKKCQDILDRYHQNPLGFLVNERKNLCERASLVIHFSINQFFRENSMPLKFNHHWTNEVQKALTIPPSSRGNVNKRRSEPTPAFNCFCQKAPEWIQYFPDIRKFGKFFGEDEDEDEEDDDEKESLPLEKAKIKMMFEIMLDIADNIEDPMLSEIKQGFAYDIEKGATCTRLDGSRFCVKKEKHLSEAQLKLSKLAYCLAHPSPEETEKRKELHRSTILAHPSPEELEKRQELHRSTCE